MRVFQYIDETVPFLRIQDAVSFAIELMEEFKVKDLPVLRDDKYLGVISEQQLLEMDGMVDTLDKVDFPLRKLSIQSDEWISAGVKKLVDEDLDVLPVLDQEKKYLGVLTKRKAFDYFGRTGMVAEPGGIFVLDVSVHDYSLAEISRIVQSNDTVVLGVQTSAAPEEGRIRITVKVSALDISYLLATFERFGYEIVDHLHLTDKSDTAKENLDALLKFIDL